MTQGYTPDANGKECVACEAGTFKATKGKTDCHKCEAGTYSTIEAATSPETCIKCPAHSTSAEGSSGVDDCKCHPGFTGANGGTCEECRAGTYKSVSGSGECVRCKDGTYSTIRGASSKDTCTPCSAVSSSKWGAGSSTCQCNKGYTGPDLGPCEPCSAGTYKSILGSESCVNVCPANSHSPPGSTVITDCKCNAGYTGADGGTCSPCGAGSYKPSAGSEECTSCPANTHSEVVASVSVTDCTCNKGHTGADCHPCAAGTYKDIKGSGDCVVCPVDTYSAVLGAISESTCEPCPEDTSSGSGSSAKSDCKCKAGSLGPGGGPCTACPSGKYQQGSECVDCPEGYTSHPGSTSAEHCLDICDAGSYGPAGGPCVLCEEGKYKGTPGSDACTDCPANTNSAKGSDELADCVCNAVGVVWLFGHACAHLPCRMGA